MKNHVLPAAIALVLATGCGNLFDPAAAVVDGEKITVDEIEAELDQFQETTRYKQLVARAPETEIERTFQQDYLTLLISETILENEAEERGIEVTAEEVNERVDVIKEEIGSEGQFQEALKEEGLDLEQLEFQVRVQLLGEELRAEVTKGVGATEEELRAYYEEHIDDYQEVRAQHILLPDDQLPLAEDLALRLQKAKPAEVDKLFASLAEKHSVDPSTSGNGGDLGWAPPTQYAEQFSAALTTLEVGEVSDPVRTEFGWHVVRVTGRRVTPFDEARDSIQETIGTEAIEEAWEQWLVEAYEEADIEINEKFGVLNPETQSVENPGADDVPGAEAPETPNASPEPTP